MTSVERNAVLNPFPSPSSTAIGLITPVSSPIGRRLFKRRPHKRKSQPHRSVPRIEDEEEKVGQGIVKLDVYGMFLKSPNVLIAAKKPITAPSSPSPSDAPKPLFRGQKAIPDELMSNVQLDMSVFNDTTNAPSVQWKGSPLDITRDSENYEKLTSEELSTCRILRILPSQYLHIKETMLKQVVKGPFKKRDAQTWFRIDVNKTNRLYDWFCGIGWIPSQQAWYEHIDDWVATGVLAMDKA